jgi:hypothetical protein
MKHLSLVTLLLTVSLFQNNPTFAQGGPQYEVTITNLTRGQQFTPILVATHREGVALFDVGTPASAQRGYEHVARIRAPCAVFSASERSLTF